MAEKYQDTWCNGKYIIRCTGQDMKEFPNAFKYGNYCSPSASAYEVILSQNGSRRFVGTYEACRNYIDIWESRR